MTNKNPITTTVRAAALVGAFSLIALSSTQAAFTPLPFGTPETPGVPLGAPMLGATGKVIAFNPQSFVDNAQPTPFASGILNSFVVDRGGGLLDFYYQVVNTSTGPDPFGDADLYRLKTLAGFDPVQNSQLVSGLLVGQTNTLTGLDTSMFPAVAGLTQGAGLQAAATADQSVGTIGSVGFDFPTQPPLPFTGNPNDVNFGESSSFLIVRTNSTVFGAIQSAISGSATAFPVGTFAAVPEPSSVLFGLAMFGVTLSSRIKARRSKSA